MFHFPNHTLKSFPDQSQGNVCMSFSSKSKAINVFPKHIPKSKALAQWNQARKKLFYQVIVENYLSNASWKFLIKIKSKWRREIKEQAPQLTLLYCGRTVILKNICKRLLFNFFNGSLLHGPKGLRSRFYNGVRLQGLSHRSSFCFKAGISRPEASRNLHSKT